MSFSWSSSNGKSFFSWRRIRLWRKETKTIQAITYHMISTPPRRSTLACPGEKHFGEELRFLAMKTELLFRRNGKALFRIWEEACCCLVFSLFADLKQEFTMYDSPSARLETIPFGFFGEYGIGRSIALLCHWNTRTVRLSSYRFLPLLFFRRFSPAWVCSFIPQGQEGER